jgi:hypothetical protein
MIIPVSFTLNSHPFELASYRRFDAFSKRNPQIDAIFSHNLDVTYGAAKKKPVRI